MIKSSLSWKILIPNSMELRENYYVTSKQVISVRQKKEVSRISIKHIKGIIISSYIKTLGEIHVPKGFGVYILLTKTRYINI